MIFPGINKLTLTDAALRLAIEGTLNAARKDGEDYIHVVEISREGYGYGDYIAHITTDQPAPVVVNIAEAA